MPSEIGKLLHEYFYLSQIAVGGLFLAIAWLFLRPSTPKSGFRPREADSPAGKTANKPRRPDPLAEARLKRPLRIAGISITGAPHEILGISPNAGLEEIQKAYRDRMKQYHPDRIASAGPQDSQWEDAQKIAEAINRAKEEMLRRKKGK